MKLSQHKQQDVHWNSFALPPPPRFFLPPLFSEWDDLIMQFIHPVCVGEFVLKEIFINSPM